MNGLAAASGPSHGSHSGSSDAPRRLRTRVRVDLEKLCQLPPMEKYSGEIQESEYGDYRGRINVRREDWVETAALLAAGIDYPNFKDAVKARQGADRAYTYMDVWTALRHLQWPQGRLAPD